MYINSKENMIQKTLGNTKTDINEKLSKTLLFPLGIGQII